MHQRAQDLAFEAELAEAVGDLETAREKFAAAAQLESAALAELADTDDRTRSAVALSAAALFYKAQDYTAAALVAHECLGRAGVEEYFRDQLRDLLESVYDEELLHAKGVEYVSNETEVSLSGGEVGFGSAPMDTVLAKIGAVSAFCKRVAEWKADLPFRQSGPPPPGLAKAFSARVTQPVAGSYKFAIRFTKASQTDLFDGLHERLDIDKLPSLIGHIVDRAAAGDSSAFENMTPYYRSAILKLVRNIVPDGRDVKEVKFVTRGRLSGSGKPILIKPAAKKEINRVIKQYQPESSSIASQTLKGVLRAVHLDQNWITIAVAEKSMKILTPEDAIDDVIGPMVNKRVVAQCVSDKKSIRLTDIELE